MACGFTLELSLKTNRSSLIYHCIHTHIHTLVFGTYNTSIKQEEGGFSVPAQHSTDLQRSRIYSTTLHLKKSLHLFPTLRLL